MGKTKYSGWFLFVILLVFWVYLAAEVPRPRTQSPLIPFFLDSLGFQTMEQAVLAPDNPDFMSDFSSGLNLNPASILGGSERVIYLDYPGNGGNHYNYSSNLFVADSYYRNSALVANRWDSSSAIMPLNAAPLYQFAALMPLSSRLSLGVTNRSFADSGPYRRIYSIDDSYYFLEDAKVSRPASNAPDHLASLDNQQSMFGTQTELTLAYQVSPTLDLGMRLGHFTMGRDGLLADSTMGTKPHETIDQVFGEDYTNQADHWEITLGTILQLSPKIRLGIQGGLITGDSRELLCTDDKDITWQELPQDIRFYDSHDYLLQKDNIITSEGNRPKARIHLEFKLSEQWKLQSALSYRWQEIDQNSHAVGYLDMTYEWTHSVYDKSHDAYYMQRVNGTGQQQDSFQGVGTHNTHQWYWTTVLTYQAADNWLIFGGLQLQAESVAIESSENTTFNADSTWIYSGHFPGNRSQHANYQSAYTYTMSSRRLGLLLPLGLRTKVVKGFYVLLGADLFFSSERLEEHGELVFAIKAASETVNDKQVYNDLERDRRESYQNNPIDLFNRANSFRFGFTYEPFLGMQVMLNTGGNLSSTASWSLGCRYSW